MMLLNSDHLDALKEFINIGVGKAAQILNDMLEAHISLDVPVLSFSKYEKVPDLLDLGHDEKLATVQLEFRGDFSGNTVLVFPHESASTLVSVLTGEEEGSPDLDLLRAETLNEVGNILINGIMGSISNLLEKKLDYIPPRYAEDRLENILIADVVKDDDVLVIKTKFEIGEHHIEGNILIFFSSISFEYLIKGIEDQLA